MDAIRKVIHLESNNIFIPELEKWHNRNVEIIILPTDETASEKAIHAFGLFQNEITLLEDFDKPLDDFKEYME
jgi:hypothetical protein